MLTTMGLDPITATIVTGVAEDFIKSFFGGGSPAPAAGLTPAQVAALLERQRQEAAASKSTLLIGVALAGAGVLAAVVLLRRR